MFNLGNRFPLTRGTWHAVSPSGASLVPHIAQSALGPIVPVVNELILLHLLGLRLLVSSRGMGTRLCFTFFTTLVLDGFNLERFSTRSFIFFFLILFSVHYHILKHLLRFSDILDEIFLITDEGDSDISVRVLTNLLEPLVEVLERLLVGDIVN